MTELNQAYDLLKSGIVEIAFTRSLIDEMDKERFHAEVTNKLVELVGYARQIEYIHHSESLQQKLWDKPLDTWGMK
jgi:iron-sulfur cluster repair protein YtfE (RIC family)